MNTLTKMKAYILPALLVLILAALTLGRISGTSLPVYSMLDGTLEEDPGLLANYPRGVRSDEWLVTTQLTIAQSAAGLPTVNPNIADGQDMAFQDVPYKSWFAVFMPQNFLFFAAPLEYAFAFKWWFVGLVLALGAYLVCLKFLPGQYLFASLTALIMLFSPMIVWWWQSGTLLPVGYALLGAWLAIKLIEVQELKGRLVYSALLAYVFLCFCLALYPPFQIVALITALALVAGWFLDHHPSGARWTKIKEVMPFLGMVLAAAAAVLGSFYLNHREAIELITHTVYPGTRVEVGGGLGLLHTFGSFLAPILQSDDRAASGFLVNQSAASSFVFISPYLVIPTIYVMVKRFRTERQVSWPLVLVSGAIILFLVKGYLAAELFQPLYKLFLLDKVPDLRLLLGFGMAGIIHVALLMKEMKSAGLTGREKNVLAVVSGVGALLFMIWVGRSVVQAYPVFAPELRPVLYLAAVIATTVFFIARSEWRIGLALLLTFSIISTYRVHPLYQGLGAVTNSPVLSTIASYPDDGSWVVLGDRLMINFPIMAGKKSVNSVHYYPQFKLWEKIDPDRSDQLTYNRFAHVLFSEEVEQDFVLQHTDLFVVRFEACGPFVAQNVKHVLSPQPLTSPCLAREVQTGTPLRPFYVYDVVTAVPGR